MTVAIEYGLIGLGALLLLVALIILLVMFIRKRKETDDLSQSGLLNSDTAGDE